MRGEVLWWRCACKQCILCLTAVGIDACLIPALHFQFEAVVRNSGRA